MRELYSWQCLACGAANQASAAVCTRCGCPAHATTKEIEAHKPAPSAAEIAAQRSEEELKRALIRESLKESQFRRFYVLSVGTYLCSMLAPDGSTLYMLAMGWIAATIGASAAWFANPLMIAAFIAIRKERDPWAWRWFAYCALGLMLSTFLTVEVEDLLPWLLPFFLMWVASAVILILGIRRYRRTLIRAPAGFHLT